MNKKILAVLLAVSVFISAFTIPALAREDVTDKTMQKVYTALDGVVNALVGGIANLIATPHWNNKADYKTENFYKGLDKKDFLDKAEDNAVWSAGYANASILTGKEVGGDGDYYVGGSLAIDKKLATEQWDDQKVRTVALSDGRGISIFSAVDCFGLANPDVRIIRAKFEEYAKSKNLDITSVNVSALHQHSCVDTFGMNGDIVDALFMSSIRTLIGQELPGGQNKEYMENLYKVAVDSMIKAVENMKTGKMYFGTVDVKEYMHDKRDPQVFDSNLNRFRFVPDEEGAKEIWIVNGSMHCVGNGAAQRELTADYPYYMEQYINEHDNADFFYILGAQLAITSDYDPLEFDEERVEKEGTVYRIRTYGETLAQKLETIKEEKEVAPILNIKFSEVWIDINNNILLLAGKGGLLKNNIHKNGFNKYAIVSEVGYAEIGEDIAIAIIPGELAPEIAFGGAETAETSWYGEDWEYPSFESKVSGRKLLVFGLTNDQVGYLLTSNNWHSIFTENEEIVSTGRYGGEQVTKAFLELLESIG